MKTPADLKPNQHCTLEGDSYGNHFWRDHLGQYHRVDENGIQDGPALICEDRSQSWHFNGKRHRLDGPAYVDPRNQYCEWWLDGMCRSQEEWSRDPRVIEFHSRTQEGAESWLTRL